MHSTMIRAAEQGNDDLVAKIRRRFRKLSRDLHGFAGRSAYHSDQICRLGPALGGLFFSAHKGYLLRLSQTTSGLLL